MSTQNATTDPHMYCALPISGQYALLQRILLYTLLWSGIIPLVQDWIAGPLLGAAMAYTSAASVHTMILITNANRTQSGLIDLDVLATFQICVVCVYSQPLLWFFYRHWKRHSSRIVVCIWAMVVYLGTICAYAALHKGRTSPAACQSGPDGAVDTSACLSFCQQLVSPGKGSRSAVIIPSYDLPKVTNIAAWMGWIPPFYSTCAALMNARERAEYMANISDWGILFCFWVIYWGMFTIVQAVVWESFLEHHPGFPAEDKLYEVGQWASWVAVTFTLLGTLVLALIERFVRNETEGNDIP